MSNQILSPDYQNSPLIVYSLDGVELVLRLPQHDGDYTPRLAASDLDILDHKLYEQGRQVSYHYLMLIENSWTYRFANSPIDAGHILLSMAVTHCEGELNKTYNFLNKASFSEWILDRLQQHYGELIEEEILELKLNELPIIEEEMWQYPKTPVELTFFEKDGAHWCCGWTGHPSIGQLDPFIRFPINKSHLVEIGIRFGGFNPEHFDSKETVDGIKEALLHEFLSHIHVTYPSNVRDEMKRQPV